MPNTCDGCGRTTEKETTIREVDDSLFELCVVCDPYSDLCLVATVESVVEELLDERNIARRIAEEDYQSDDEEDRKMAEQFDGRAEGFDEATRRLTRVVGQYGMTVLREFKSDSDTERVNP